ncbi:winged helix-turn-helix transcriptional regulator [Crossiella sp. CA-258035]|uniref:winged helix-turn-helix transcriptional regulator n=1 Tax=Crossiella sp. CA-258035 TaxID=2981138 RepID=UPI0024BC89D6|nr:winged helix-turn-helix transcriptional regulator [Crossiella sp. CA-258035]WHT22549.1 winged helix-turn-helix transcriptional regulator [Crossiella sp. CA-258035]
MDEKDWQSMAAAARAMSGVWVPAVLFALSRSNGPLRFKQLVEQVRSADPEHGAPPDGRALYNSTLVQTLQIMERDGLVKREERVRTIPRVVTYELTESARKLIAVMGTVRDWRGLKQEDSPAGRVEWKSWR